MKRAAGDYFVGRLIRRLDGNSFVTSILPRHHDVDIYKWTESYRRGFFADDFEDAITEAMLWFSVTAMFGGEAAEDFGWVFGHVGNEGPWGKDRTRKVRYERYETVKKRILSAGAEPYHLALFNCQHWATKQLQ